MINQKWVGSLLIAMIICSFSQIVRADDMTRTELIASKWENGNVEYALSAIEYFNSDLSIERYGFVLLAQNSKYEYVENLFQLVVGDAQQVYNFTKWVLAFINTCKIEKLAYPNEELGFTIELYNWGAFLGKVYFIRKDNSYHVFKKSDIEKIQKKLLAYCKKQKIEINTTTPVNINEALKGN